MKRVLSELPEKDVPLRTLIDLNAPQAILYTSGTTGQPKGRSSRMECSGGMLLARLSILGTISTIVGLPVCRSIHIGGLSILMRSVIYGISVVVHEKFDPVCVSIAALLEDRITIISVVAVMLQRMLAALDSNAERSQLSRHAALCAAGRWSRSLSAT